MLARFVFFLFSFDGIGQSIGQSMKLFLTGPGQIGKTGVAHYVDILYIL